MSTIKPGTGNKNITININKNFCKQCGICINFCPKKVFGSDESRYPTVVDLEACTACRLCELMCPDFAIDIEVKD